MTRSPRTTIDSILYPEDLVESIDVLYIYTEKSVRGTRRKVVTFNNTESKEVIVE